MKPAPYVQDRVGTTIASRYAITAVLGQGGTATVYKATDLRLGHTVAVKVLSIKHPTADRRMEREARVAASLQHPNVCLVTDFGRLDDRTPYFVMELLVGRSVGALLREMGTLHGDQVADIAKQVLSVLHVAHSRGVVHRDIKPENLFLAEVVGRPPLVKVFDFGIATADCEEGLTGKGSIVGTPAYMSPEQVMGDESIDGRSDIYACGLVMYECLAGLAPYKDPKRSQLLEKIIRGGAPSIATFRPDLSPILVRAIDQAIRVEREARFQSALEMLDVLDGRVSLPEATWEAETDRFADKSPLPSFDLPQDPLARESFREADYTFDDATESFVPKTTRRGPTR